MQARLELELSNVQKRELTVMAKVRLNEALEEVRNMVTEKRIAAASLHCTIGCYVATVLYFLASAEDYDIPVQCSCTGVLSLNDIFLIQSVVIRFFL